MPSYSYRTIKSPSQGSFKEKGSRFLSFAYPVDTDGAIQIHLDQIRREYFDARHHCYAWMLGPEKKQFKAVDDGEPGHSAGDPILGQIRSHDLTQILIVVVRYFGGIKLGVGGLIKAYREAAADAIRNASIIEEEVVVNGTLTYPFDKTSDVMRMIKDFQVQLIEQSYNTNCVLTIGVPLRNQLLLLDRISQLNIPKHCVEFVKH
ncbi:YigZ family protein [Chryseolinea sp. T2]|uniref:IMPACT family protein n=1 Tax=Chryseolinea sp. T2 TaxID=3129255 RepID=UPI0030788A46